tara:strand:+ start:2382 stop:3314 length:933 start_codon:yes stop_codon:yes gene_type:complete
MIKVFFCCSWDPDPKHFLEDKYLPLTKNSSGVWGNITAVTDMKEADWIVIADDIHGSQRQDILSFDPNKVICLPREPERTSPEYMRYPFKYKFTYQNFYHCWTSIMCVQKTYDDLANFKYRLKTKPCSTITSSYNNGTGIYGKRVEFIKRLSREQRFMDKIDIFGYGWKEGELTSMYKGVFGGFNPPSRSNHVDVVIPNTTKWNGLEDYSYSIAIENSCVENYFSEKFSDCILAWTIPIYYGCPNIHKYFPKNCYYWLDIDSPDVFNQLERILNTPITPKQIKAMELAREIILNRQNIWNVVDTTIKKDQ